MTVQERIAALDALEARLHAYHHAMGVLTYDGETIAPRRSAVGRGQTLACLAGVVHDLYTCTQTKELLAALKEDDAALDPKVRRRVELLCETCDDLTRVPADEYAAYQALLAEAGGVWHEAKPRSDYAAFAPYLERIIEYNRRWAARKDASKPAYDVLLDDYEKGTTMAELDAFFARLRAELTPLILELAQRPKPDTAFAHQYYPIQTQRELSKRVMALLGIDADRCSIGETEHPFTDGFNRCDVRITTHYDEHDVLSSLYSVIHEGGHAIYELGSAEELEGTCLAGGSSMGIHESQSRFYENLIGRSEAFCEALLPHMAECFPEQLRGVDARALYRAVNRVERSLVRTEADELTYPMHIMVRYELEKRMVGGELKVGDIPGEWNRMMREYLGVEVPDDRRGALQDTHWASGLVGYFPSYALGSAYGAQMLRRMEASFDVWGAVRSGNIAPVTAWLGERIHRHGCLLKPKQLIENACGGAFDPKYYTEYLIDKYTKLYGI